MKQIKTILLLFTFSYELTARYIVPIMYFLYTFKIAKLNVLNCFFQYNPIIVVVSYFIFALPIIIKSGIFGKGKCYHIVNNYYDWICY